MWRFKTEKEFRKDGRWTSRYGNEFPKWWNADEEMNAYLGTEIPIKYHEYCEEGRGFELRGWHFKGTDYIFEPDLEEIYEIY